MTLTFLREIFMTATSTTDDVERTWQLIGKIGIAMLVTRDGEELRARPMAAHVAEDDNAIYFLTDARRHKDVEIAQSPQVNLSFADPGGQTYVSVSGTAAVSNDRAAIKRLFSTAAKAWWSSADDPDIRVLTVTPHHAEYWDASGKLVRAIKMAAAAATGTRPELGDNRKVSM